MVSPRSAATLFACGWLISAYAHAEGSRSLYPASYPAGGNRADLDVSEPFTKYAGQVARRAFLYVYAETGEYILTGSRNRSNGGDIQIFNPQDFGKRGDETIPSTPNFTCSGGSTQPGQHYAGTGRGIIATRAQELAGPHSANGTVTVPNGFLPCAYQAPVSGLFGVVLTPATSGGGNPSGSMNPTLGSGSISAWDVVIRTNAGSTIDLNGRLFTFAFLANTGGGNRRFYSELFYVTEDGHRYRQTFRGIDGNGFGLYANNSGFLDSGNPLYHDIRGKDFAISALPKGISSEPAYLPVFFSDVTPGTPNAGEVAKVLGAIGIPFVPLVPRVSSIVFVGALGQGSTRVGAGGNFIFQSTNTLTFEILISRDGVNFDPTNPLNRVLRGTAKSGAHTVLWNGRDNAGNLFPAGLDYSFRLTGRNGEAHLPMLDIEGSLDGGPTIHKLTGSGGDTVYYDDRGYTTANGVNVGTPNGLLCGSTPPVPTSPVEAVAGIDSNVITGGHYPRFWPAIGNTNLDCNTGSGFGDTKGLDLWVYEGTTSIAGTLSIFDQTAFTDVGTSIAVPSEVFPGDTVFGSLQFRNDGLLPAENVTYGLTLGSPGNRPTGVIFPTLSSTAYSYDPVSGIVTFSSLPATLAGSTTISLPFNYVAVSGEYPVRTTISASNEGAEQTSPNSADGLTTVVRADLITTVTVPPTAAIGATVAGEVTFENSVDATVFATGVVYSLTIGDATLRPAAVTFTNLPPESTASYSSTSGNVTFTGLPTILGIGTGIGVRFTYIAPAPGTIPVTASVTTVTPETTLANNSDTGSTTFVQFPDLTITKTHAGAFTQGQIGATFMITVTNLGPGSTLSPVSIADVLPTGLTATGMDGPGWTCNRLELTCERSDSIGIGSYPGITLTVDVALDAPAALTNEVTVSGGGETNTTNNLAQDAVTVVQLPDLTIDKSHTDTFDPGASGARYNLTVTNVGPGPTTSTVTVVDTLPAGLTATAIAGLNWTCTLATLTCTRSDVLAPTLSYEDIIVTVDVANNALGIIENKADVSGGGDLDSGNNSDLDSTVITPVPDLIIDKSHAGVFKQGQTGAMFTLTVTNVGVVETSGTVTVTDTLPPGLTATAIAGAGWVCTLAPLSCSTSTPLLPQQNYPPITLTVDVSLTAPPTLVNSADVSGGGELGPPNNTDTDTVVTVPAPDLALTKTAVGTFVEGGTGSFTIKIQNLSVVDSSGDVTVTDLLPAGLTAIAMSGPGWACDVDTLTCQRVNALKGGEVFGEILLVVDIGPTAVGTLTNTATVSGGGDTNPANNTGTADVTIVVPPDLSITKTSNGPFLPGAIGVMYTVAVQNVGTVTHVGPVVAADLLPSGLTATLIEGPGWTCTIAARCDRSDDLLPGASYPPITVTANVSSSSRGDLTNVAAVAGVGETNLDNNFVRNETTVLPPLCSRIDNCFEFALFEADFAQSPGNAVLTWRLSSTCSEPLTRVDFRFVPGGPAISPTEGSQYTSRGRTYSVDVVGGPHPGIGFIAATSPILANEFDDFTFTVSAADLQANTVLWNSAAAGSQTGRMDMRSELCFSLPPPGIRQSVPALPSPLTLAGLGLFAFVGFLISRRWKRV